MSYTLVSFHAHPDDEALFTGGTLARVSAEGHRVVLVTATAGQAGLVSTDVLRAGSLAETRLAELQQAAAVLGCHEVHLLDYDDSGSDGRSGREGRAFARVDVESAAVGLAALLRSVGADVLTVYDPAGGYGHPDHIQVNRVGLRAAELAGTPVVLEATVDRRLLLRVLWLLHMLRVTPPEWAPHRFTMAYTPPQHLTHRVDVRRYATAKRNAMAAHSSQTTAESGVRSLAVFLRMPPALFRLVFGQEWFIEVGRQRDGRLVGDVFDSLRGRQRGPRG